MHYEWMGLPESARIDSVQFHVSSSLKKAEKYIRCQGVDSHSWYQVHPYVLDARGDDRYIEGVEVYYYNHRGTRLKSPPTGRTLSAFRRHVARYPQFYSVPLSK